MKPLLLFVASSLAALLSPLESILEAPQGWTLYSTPAPTDVISLSISLRHDEGDEELFRRLHEISDPGSKEYGKFLSCEEVRALRTPSGETSDAVLTWLGEGGVVGRVEGDWVRVSVTAQQARELLGAEVGYYTFSDGERETGPVLRARGYGVPDGVRSSVGFVHPLSNFLPPLRHDDGPVGYGAGARRQSSPRPRYTQPRQTLDEPMNSVSAPPKPGSCTNRTTPECIRRLYNISYSPDSTSASPVTYAVAGFLEQWLYHPDTHAFAAAHAPYVPEPHRNVSVALINNGTDPQAMSRAGLEASLDVQYALALAHTVPVTYHSTGGRGVKLDSSGDSLPESRTDNEPYLEWLEHLLGMPDEELPRVIAVSYADDEQGVPRAYAQKVCALFAALAARGASVMVATGDGGARGVRKGECLSNDGARRRATVASFPATCPFVTAVGAVDELEPPRVADFSTGGFSNYFPRPRFQSADVEGYIRRLGGHLEGRYNASGRAIPDISAIGTNFVVEWGGGPGSADGTSASVPVVASMVALINDARRRRGLPWTGWLNPRLYSREVRGVMRDVVGGSSVGCEWEGEVPGGWKAKEGWDAGTGIGVPGNFVELLGVFLEDGGSGGE